ncbi:MAG: hypothetical protein WC969_15310 [Elusimicrobiota bacterium]|jgi:hypothetical protein
MGGPGSGRKKHGQMSYPRATAKAKAVSYAVIDSGMTRREISALAKVSAGWGSDILAGRVSCKKEIAERYADVLKQPLLVLFFIEEAPPANQPVTSAPPKQPRKVRPPAEPPEQGSLPLVDTDAKTGHAA